MQVITKSHIRVQLCPAAATVDVAVPTRGTFLCYRLRTTTISFTKQTGAMRPGLVRTALHAAHTLRVATEPAGAAADAAPRVVVAFGLAVQPGVGCSSTSCRTPGGPGQG
eukprot:scaffold63456_cov55-Phaeocystis_antarctica.AAC.1